MDLTPQELYAAFNANYKAKEEGLSSQTKEYLSQELERLTKEREAAEREAKRQAGLAKRRNTKKGPDGQEENT